MSQLLRRQCFQHPDREAAARCQECQQSFCRECVTEHGERFICAPCLARLAAPAEPASGRLPWARALAPLAGAGAGLLVSWIFFYTLGRLLMLLPAAMHQTEIWSNTLD